MTREIRRTPEVTASLTIQKLPVKQVILQCRIVVWYVHLFPEHAWQRRLGLNPHQGFKQKSIAYSRVTAGDMASCCYSCLLLSLVLSPIIGYVFNNDNLVRVQ